MPQNQKIHRVIVLSSIIMILQGLRHPISCLGVCYANDPQKGGCMASAPTLDLTTSLRGDLIFVHQVFESIDGSLLLIGR